MKNRSPLAFTVAAMFMASSASAWALTTNDFVQKAAIGGQFEISSSRLALTNSQNDNVKNLAQELIDDHKKIDDDMNSVLQSADPAKTPPSMALDSSHQKMLDKLNDARGSDFDKLYVDDQAKAHKEAVGLFKKYAKDGDDEALKSFAAQTLPVLHKHQNDVKQLQKSMP